MTALAALPPGHLATRVHPCSGAADGPPLVLLHGWGGDARVWAPVLPALCRSRQVITLELPGFGGSAPCGHWQQAVAAIAASLPPRCVLIGWSLGGMLAARVAAACPERVDSLVTLASNASFIARPDWPAAMAEPVFRAFRASFAANPVAALRQFQALEAKGDPREREVLRQLRGMAASPQPQPWLQALDWLAELDNRELLAALPVPALHLFTAGDALVPAAAAKALGALCPGARVEVLAGCGHAPHLSQPDGLAASILGFLAAPRAKAHPYTLDKGRIAASFGRAAASYDGVATLQREVGGRLLAQLPAGLAPGAVADMGCGTGHFVPRLAARFPGALCTGIDLAPGMIAHARQHHGGDRLRWLCADAECLPLADASVDLIFSNFAFQWCQDLAALMTEQFRLLAPGGLLAFTTVAPRSLWELRQAWGAVDGYVHVNQFAPLAEVRGALAAAGFAIATWHLETRTRHYGQLGELTRELKCLGAHNVNGGRNTGLTGRRRIAGLIAAYESLREDAGLPATWELLYVVARKPGELR